MAKTEKKPVMRNGAIYNAYDGTIFNFEYSNRADLMTKVFNYLDENYDCEVDDDDIKVDLEDENITFRWMGAIARSCFAKGRMSKQEAFSHMTKGMDTSRQFTFTVEKNSTKQREIEARAIDKARMTLLLEKIHQNAVELAVNELLEEYIKENITEQAEELNCMNREFKKLIAYLRGKEVQLPIEMWRVANGIGNARVKYHKKFTEALKTAEDEATVDYIHEDYRNFESDCKTMENYFDWLAENVKYVGPAIQAWLKKRKEAQGGC